VDNILQLEKSLNRFKNFLKLEDKYLKKGKIVCPLCKKEFETYDLLSSHIKTTANKHHLLLQYLITENNILLEDINILFLVCIEQFKEEELDNFVIPKKTTKKRKPVEQEEITDNEDESTVVVKKVSAPALLKYFYNKLGIDCPPERVVKEASQVKNLLRSRTPEEIKIGFDYLLKQGNQDIKFLNYSMNDALLENKLLVEIDKENTPGYLLNYYYMSFGLQINSVTFLRECKKIIRLIEHGYTEQQVKAVIDYMIKEKVTTFNFIDSKINSALGNVSLKENNIASEIIEKHQYNVKFDENKKEELMGDIKRLITTLRKANNNNNLLKCQMSFYDLTEINYNSLSDEEKQRFVDFIKFSIKSGLYYNAKTNSKASLIIKTKLYKYIDDKELLQLIAEEQKSRTMISNYLSKKEKENTDLYQWLLKNKDILLE